MIGYATIGCNDLESGGAFYDALLAVLGANRFMTNDRMIMYGVNPGDGMLAICTPYDDNVATVGNGTMIGLNAGSQANVDKLHAKAMELGGKDEGEPGTRGDGGGFYGGYFRDLDGNKLVAYCMG